MIEPAPQSPSSPQIALPFFTITVLANGQLQSQTNLKDKALILGLLETAKFQVMLAPPEQWAAEPLKPALYKPHDSFAQEMLRKMRG